MKARIASNSAPQAASWIQPLILSGPAGEKMFAGRHALSPWFTDAQFSVLMRLRMGLPVASCDQPCSMCHHAHVADQYGYHAMCCKGSGHRTKCHNTLRDYFFSLLSVGLLGPHKEAHCFPEHPTWRIDLLVGNMACDVAITNPFRPEAVRAAAEFPGGAATAYEAVKHAKYGESARLNGLTLVPLVVDTLGAWGAASAPLFAILARALAERLELPYARVLAQVRQHINALHMRNVSNLLLRATPPTLDGPWNAMEVARCRQNAVQVIPAAAARAAADHHLAAPPPSSSPLGSSDDTAVAGAEQVRVASCDSVVVLAAPRADEAATVSFAAHVASGPPSAIVTQEPASQLVQQSQAQHLPVVSVDEASFAYAAPTPSPATAAGQQQQPLPTPSSTQLPPPLSSSSSSSPPQPLSLPLSSPSPLLSTADFAAFLSAAPAERHLEHEELQEQSATAEQLLPPSSPPTPRSSVAAEAGDSCTAEGSSGSSYPSL